MVDAMLQYKTKGSAKLLPDKVGVSYQLNVYNLLDNRDVIISSRVTSLDGRNLSPPRLARKPAMVNFTTRLDF